MRRLVYLVTFEQKHQTGHLVCATKEVAVKTLLEWVNGRREMFEVPETISDEQALENWFEYTGYTENIYYDIKPVITS